MVSKIVKQKLSHEELATITKENYGDMMKVVVDIEKGICAVGGEFHAEGKKLLMEKEGCEAKNLYGARLYPWQSPENRLDYTSQINPRPEEGRNNATIEDKDLRKTIKAVINKLLLDDTEQLN